MMIIRFKSSKDHEDLLHKVKKMKEFTEDIEECLEDAMMDEEPEYRSMGGYRKDDYDDYEMRGGRYSYRRGGRR